MSFSRRRDRVSVRWDLVGHVIGMPSSPSTSFGRCRLAVEQHGKKMISYVNRFIIFLQFNKSLPSSCFSDVTRSSPCIRIQTSRTLHLLKSHHCFCGSPCCSFNIQSVAVPVLQLAIPEPRLVSWNRTAYYVPFVIFPFIEHKGFSSQ